MHILLTLHFITSVAMLPYPSMETCQAAAVYYHQHYGEELKKATCRKIKEENSAHD